MTDEFVSIRAIAAYFGLTPAAIYKYVSRGQIAARRIGGAVRVTRDEFEYIKSHGLRPVAVKPTPTPVTA
jgi:excisionase family DNA binding protein